VNLVDENANLQLLGTAACCSAGEENDGDFSYDEDDRIDDILTGNALENEDAEDESAKLKPVIAYAKTAKAFGAFITAKNYEKRLNDHPWIACSKLAHADAWKSNHVCCKMCSGFISVPDKSKANRHQKSCFQKQQQNKLPEVVKAMQQRAKPHESERVNLGYALLLSLGLSFRQSVEVSKPMILRLLTQTSPIQSHSTVSNTCVPGAQKMIKEEITERLRNHQLTICVDSTLTGAYGTNFTAIQAVSPAANVSSVKGAFTLDVKVSPEHYNAANLAIELRSVVQDHNIEPTQIVGICSDNASVMTAATQKFKDLVGEPNILRIRCVAHGLHLVISHALKVFPSISRLAQSIGMVIFKQGQAKHERTSALQGEGVKTTPLNLAPTRWGAVVEALAEICSSWKTILTCFEDWGAASDAEILQEAIHKLKDVHLHFECLVVLPVLRDFAAQIERAQAVFVSYDTVSSLLSAYEDAKLQSRESCEEHIRDEFQRVKVSAGLHELVLDELCGPLAERLLTAYKRITDEFEKVLLTSLRQLEESYAFTGYGVENARAKRPAPKFKYVCDPGAENGQSFRNLWRSKLSGAEFEDLPKDIEEAAAFWAKLESPASSDAVRRLALVASRALALCASNATVERAFSTLNRMTKDKLRNRLSVARQSDHAYLMLNRPVAEHLGKVYDPQRFVELD
jgi:hypothetical protein